MYISTLLFAILPLAVHGQDFSWINPELSQVISYQEVHFSECSAFPDLCPPTLANCASQLCSNCPKYYDTCCLQSTTAADACFQSLASVHGAGGGGGAPASASAAATSGASRANAAATVGAVATGSSGGSPSASSGNSAGAAKTPSSTGGMPKASLMAEMALLPMAVAAMLVD